LTAGGALTRFLLEGLFDGDLGEQMTAGHDCRVAGAELFGYNGTHLFLALGKREKLFGYEEAEFALWWFQ